MKSNNKKLEEEVEKLRKKLKDLERWFSLQDGQIRVLERERQKFSSIVHQTDAGFLALDSSLKVIWFNSDFINRLGMGI